MSQNHSATIITATDPARSDYLPEAADSVAAVAALLADNCSIHWVIIIDGPGPIPQLRLPPNSLVHRSPTRCGTAAARNLGLVLSSSEWIFPLDHDDILIPSGFSALLNDAIEHDVCWTAGNHVFFDDRPTIHQVTQERLVQQSELGDSWTSPFCFHPNNIIARRESVLSVGGWPALTVAADLGLALILNETYAGYLTCHTSVRYRLWDKQVSADPGLEDTKRVEYEFIAAHLNALRAMRGAPAVRQPTPWPGTHRRAISGQLL